MNGEVEAHELCEIGVVVSQHAGEVVAPVFVHVYYPHGGPGPVQVSVDDGRDGGESCDEIHSVLIHILKVKKISLQLVCRHTLL